MCLLIVESMPFSAIENTFLSKPKLDVSIDYYMCYYNGLTFGYDFTSNITFLRCTITSVRLYNHINKR